MGDRTIAGLPGLAGRSVGLIRGAAVGPIGPAAGGAPGGHVVNVTIGNSPDSSFLDGYNNGQAPGLSATPFGSLDPSGFMINGETFVRVTTRGNSGVAALVIDVLGSHAQSLWTSFEWFGAANAGPFSVLSADSTNFQLTGGVSRWNFSGTPNDSGWGAGDVGQIRQCTFTWP